MREKTTTKIVTHYSSAECGLDALPVIDGGGASEGVLDGTSGAGREDCGRTSQVRAPA